MNKRGITILELLISMTIVCMVVLLLIKVLVSLNDINNDDTYASGDEIARTEIIKMMESDFLKLGLIGLNISENNDNIIITFNYLYERRELIIRSDSLEYNNTIYKLKSNDASYSKCLEYSYTLLDGDYYLVNINIPVLIRGENTTINDDISLTYLSLLKEETDFPYIYTCVK